MAKVQALDTVINFEQDFEQLGALDVDNVANVATVLINETAYNEGMLVASAWPA